MAFKPPAETPKGLWRRVPPAIFPSIMGFFGLGLAWRRASGTFAVPAGIGEALLGAAALLFCFAAVAYGAKILRRPTVLAEELRTLPGRAGVATLILSVYLLSMAMYPYAGELARWILMAGFVVHGVFLAVLIYVLVTGPREQRRITPVWHLSFVGYIIGALAAQPFELYGLMIVIFASTAIIAAAIWSVSADQLVRQDVPAPLRPLLAIHLSPIALLGLVAEALGLDVVATGCAVVAFLMMLWFLARAFWLTKAGFSALWGAFTFPLAATASLWLALDGVWRVPGGVTLVLASLIVPAILYRLLRLWAQGQLAIKTNAAIA